MNKKTEKGITLIALVITIIVLLILVMITIAAITGPNGIMNKATTAKTENAKGEIQDRVRTEVMGSYDEDGKIDWELLEDNLVANVGAKDVRATDDVDKRNGITFEVEKNGKDYTVTVDPNGNVTLTSEGEGAGGSSSDPSASTMKVELKVDEVNVTGAKIPVSVTKITTDKNEDKTNDENLTYKWYINNATSKDDNGTSECTFNDLDDKTTYTIKCLVTDNSTGEQGTGAVTVLSFQVVDSLYRGTQGMTWHEWIESDYQRPFPLNEDHYHQFLMDCGWSSDVQGKLLDYGQSYSPNVNSEDKDAFMSYGCALGHGLFATASGGGFGFYDKFWHAYLIFHAEENDSSLLPDSPLEHLRIFVDSKYDSSSPDQYYDNVQDFVDHASCVAEGTLITLADGAKTAVENLKGDEKVLVWNMYSGKYEASDIAFIVNHNEESKERKIIHTYFSDGTDIEIIKDHGFFDLDLNKFVLIDETNYKNYIGHWFVKESLNGDKQHEKVQLTDVEMESKKSRVYEVITPKNLTCFTNGLLSVSSFLDKFCNIFEVDSNTLTYNKELMEKDIDKYGIFSYEEYQGKLSKQAYEMLNLQYMKVALGKGIITQEHRLYLRDFFNGNAANFKSKFDL